MKRVVTGELDAVPLLVLLAPVDARPVLAPGEHKPVLKDGDVSAGGRGGVREHVARRVDLLAVCECGVRCDAGSVRGHGQVQRRVRGRDLRAVHTKRRASLLSGGPDRVHRKVGKGAGERDAQLNRRRGFVEVALRVGPRLGEHEGASTCRERPVGGGAYDRRACVDQDRRVVKPLFDELRPVEDVGARAREESDAVSLCKAELAQIARAHGRNSDLNLSGVGAARCHVVAPQFHEAVAEPRDCVETTRGHSARRVCVGVFGEERLAHSEARDDVGGGRARTPRS